MRDSQVRNLERWFRLWVVLLGHRRPTADDLAHEFGVARRTIFRDLLALEKMGVPVQRLDGRYTVMEKYRMPPVQFTPEEVHALVAALDFARRRKSLGGPAASQALDKLLAAMPISHQEIAAGLDEVLVVEPWQAQSREDPTVDKQIRAAIQGRHPIRIRHTAMGRVQATERVVHPFGLAYRGTGLYVIGHCELRGEMRNFRVNRIESVQVLPATFERPADFDLEAYLSQVWGIEGGPPMEVRIRYDPGVAQLAKETQWHPSQRLHQEPDGSVVLEMRVKGKNELARWLAGYGGSVEVLAPAELREAVSGLGLDIVQRYGTGTSRSGKSPP